MDHQEIPLSETVLTLTPNLQSPQPVTDRYMLLPVEEGFSWQNCFSAIDAGEWYLVVFRCKHRPDADEALLTHLDAFAGAAARLTPGFLYYFPGTPAPTGECLSFCLWTDQQAARAGASHPSHRDAMSRGVAFYEYYDLERHQIRKQDGHLIFVRL
ncbi:MAG TPA: antibiotic biosynthesis monooxygenase [Phototrophicaceae bacterium]|jgi:hypothetical protein|nr:antibiotic biosynthesis monooxygenase [Phototrophicaceae bacterium]